MKSYAIEGVPMQLLPRVARICLVLVKGSTISQHVIPLAPLLFPKDAEKYPIQMVFLFAFCSVAEVLPASLEESVKRNCRTLPCHP